MIQFDIFDATLRHRFKGDVCSQTELLQQDLRSSETVRTTDFRLVPQVSEPSIGPIFKYQAVEEE
jgi:hypothetical protein